MARFLDVLCGVNHTAPLLNVTRLLLLVASTGCGAVLARAAEGGVEGTVDAMNAPQTQQQALEIADSPEIQEATRLLAASATAGVIEGVRAELAGQGGQLDEQAEAALTTLGERTEEIMRKDIAPGAAAIVGRSVDRAFATAASPDNLERIRRVSAAAAEAAVTGMTTSMAATIRDDVVPAVPAAKDAARGMLVRAVADEEFKEALGAIAYEMSREAVLGSKGALDTIQREGEADGDAPMGALAKAFGVGAGILFGLFAAIAAVFVTLVVMVFRGSGQRKRLSQENRASERRTSDLIHMMMAAPGRTPAPKDGDGEKVGVLPPEEARLGAVGGARI